MTTPQQRTTDDSAANTPLRSPQAAKTSQNLDQAESKLAATVRAVVEIEAAKQLGTFAAGLATSPARAAVDAVGEVLLPVVTGMLSGALGGTPFGTNGNKGQVRVPGSAATVTDAARAETGRVSANVRAYARDRVQNALAALLGRQEARHGRFDEGASPDDTQTEYGTPDPQGDVTSEVRRILHRLTTPDAVDATQTNVNSGNGNVYRPRSGRDATADMDGMAPSSERPAGHAYERLPEFGVSEATDPGDRAQTILPRWDGSSPLNVAGSDGMTPSESVEDYARGAVSDPLGGRATSAAANRIARSAVRDCVFGAQDGLFAAAGDANGRQGAMRKRWWSMHDSRVRHAHDALDGESVKAGQAFQSELGPIRWPGDSEADPSNTYGCRCVLEWLPADGEG